MSREGYEKLLAERKRLEAQRPAVQKAIQAAREKGDLTENAEYLAAMEEQRLLEARIRELATRLSRAKLVDYPRVASDEVTIGATVRLYDPALDAEDEYRLVGAGEEDPLANKILTTSPMGQAMLNKKVGDYFEVQGPNRSFSYQVREIRYER